MPMDNIAKHSNTTTNSSAVKTIQFFKNPPNNHQANNSFQNTRTSPLNPTNMDSVIHEQDYEDSQAVS